MSEPRALFVTGTDTGVGKTVVASWLAARLAPSARVALVKPFQTGASDPARDGDEAFYRAALGDARVTIRTLVTLPEPLAPAIAAARAGRPIDVAAALVECRVLQKQHDTTLVEGAGGLLVSIAGETDMASFAAALDASLVVVARPSLGTLNHTALTLDAAERRGLEVELLAVSGFPSDAGVVEWENLRFLQQRYPDLPLVVLSRGPLARADPLAGIETWTLGPPSMLLAGLSLAPLELPAQRSEA